MNDLHVERRALLTRVPAHLVPRIRALAGSLDLSVSQWIAEQIVREAGRMRIEIVETQNDEAEQPHPA
jgi:hypothetical protein